MKSLISFSLGLTKLGYIKMRFCFLFQLHDSYRCRKLLYLLFTVFYLEDRTRVTVTH